MPVNPLFFDTYIQPTGLRFVNADVIALELGLGPYAAAEIAGRVRDAMINRGESFAFETVLSDPEGEKVRFLRRASADGYTVVFCFIGLESAAVSDRRVTMRVSKGGHDVPKEKLVARFPRSLTNLARAVATLPCVFVFDNSRLYSR